MVWPYIYIYNIKLDQIIKYSNMTRTHNGVIGNTNIPKNENTRARGT